MISLLRPFSYSCILCLFSQQFYDFFLSFNFPWYLPEKSGNICLFFRHVYSILNGFYLFNLFSWAIFFFYSLIYLLFIRIFLYSNFHLFIYFFTHLSYPFELFSISYYLFILCSLLLLNCANSVLFLVCSLTAHYHTIGCLHIGLLLSTGT